ncbi:MAG: PH domain-containing protein [Rikenellaceae bacterium]
MSSAKKIYKYNFDRKTIYLTIVHIVIVSALGVLLYMLYDDGYFSAWFASFVVALFCLMALSIPRRVELTPHKLSVVCLLELTEIDIAEIVSMRKVNPRSVRFFIPYLGSYGFFGYYGQFIDLRRFERFKVYATEWRYLIEIVDIYEDRYYISCREGDNLMAQIKEYQREPLAKL